jgi:type III pantothenate kinase
MHNLVIDVGNTNSKIAVFHSRTLVAFASVLQLEPRRIAELLEQYHISQAAVSSVNDEEIEVKELLKAHCRYIEFSTQVNPGIKNNYKTPETLGLDRWAKVIAAYRLYPGETCFIIDAGTCITYDLLNSDASYDGGSISLGLHMRFQALNHFTERLPLVKWQDTSAAIPDGLDTLTAIQQGVLQGLVYEVAGFINNQYIKNNKIKVLMTGGDAPFFLNQLKGYNFAAQVVHEPYLVLKGLNEVIAFEYVQKN